ncbi:MAG TPA: ATP-binding protein [Parapedobacter sp.]|uniref:ATP-binding protein n=1 Tax=Parapedobacter sp. TaxID=1958893 RepID=UPI002C14D156|nr:ATP-binding protein [Parapedobacter sp.]HWK59478.1 ATP-binding protein [Parapedobacter sp.]
MNIQSLITKQYTTIDAYAGTGYATDLLRTADVLVVVENEKPIGILTASDLAMKRHQIVVDCLGPWPSVNSNESISSVLNRMKATGATALPVTFKGSFYGIIKQIDLLTHLYIDHEKQRAALLAAAHDLRSPIASITMLGTILRADPALRKHQELIDKLSESCDYAQILIKDILTTEQSPTETLILETENIDELVDGCAASLSEQLNSKQLVLSKQLYSNLNVRVDRHKLKRAIHNMLSNSIKFSHPGGTITLSTRAAPGDRVFLVVRDTGIGIPEHMRERIFDKFTKARRPGTAGEPTTGLGLYLTKTIIELHGGTIEMESDGKTGTSFIVSLPA